MGSCEGEAGGAAIALIAPENATTRKADTISVVLANGNNSCDLVPQLRLRISNSDRGTDVQRGKRLAASLVQ